VLFLSFSSIILFSLGRFLVSIISVSKKFSSVLFCISIFPLDLSKYFLECVLFLNFSSIILFSFEWFLRFIILEYKNFLPFLLVSLFSLKLSKGFLDCVSLLNLSSNILFSFERSLLRYSVNIFCTYG
jgi:hypothetical protein